MEQRIKTMRNRIDGMIKKEENKIWEEHIKMMTFLNEFFTFANIVQDF
jgi:hypothetical protein